MGMVSARMLLWRSRALNPANIRIQLKLLECAVYFLNACSIQLPDALEKKKIELVTIAHFLYIRLYLFASE